MRAKACPIQSVLYILAQIVAPVCELFKSVLGSDNPEPTSSGNA